MVSEVGTMHSKLIHLGEKKKKHPKRNKASMQSRGLTAQLGSPHMLLSLCPHSPTGALAVSFSFLQS